ncbi:putative inner membrane protein [Chlamydia psittaci VS225]|nr:putative inner membrane protein [Chlamydia psittaci VS225]
MYVLSFLTVVYYKHMSFIIIILFLLFSMTYGNFQSFCLPNTSKARSSLSIHGKKETNKISNNNINCFESFIYYFRSYFLSILPSCVNIIISLLCAGVSWCILSFVTAQIIIKYSQPKYSHIPFGFRCVIKSEFPKAFFDLVTTQDLKFANFRELLIYIHDFRESNDTSIRNNLCKLSPQLKKALEDFGVDNFNTEINGQYLPSLNNLLIENCPLYWMKRFIELGNKNVLRENLEKYNRGYSGTYWFCELDSIRRPVSPRTEHGTIFLLQSYGLVQELSQEEYVF